MNPGEVQFDTLVTDQGFLDAVDRFEGAELKSTYGRTYHGAVIRFRLNGIVYIACEDDNDGYRSSMETLRVGRQEMTNVFEPVEVEVRNLRRRGSEFGDGQGEACEILQLWDTHTNQLVLEVGTDRNDDYYPSFVGAFFPEAMSVNVKLPPLPPEPLSAEQLAYNERFGAWA